MRPEPGDKVIVIQSAYDNMLPFCVATKGSIGVALSFEEYCEVFDKGSSDLVYPHYLKRWMKNGYQFPFRLQQVAPLDPADKDDYIHLSVREDRVVVLGYEFFKIIEIQDKGTWSLDQPPLIGPVFMW